MKPSPSTEHRDDLGSGLALIMTSSDCPQNHKIIIRVSNKCWWLWIVLIIFQYSVPGRVSSSVYHVGLLLLLSPAFIPQWWVSGGVASKICELSKSHSSVLGCSKPGSRNICTCNAMTSTSDYKSCFIFHLSIAVLIRVGILQKIPILSAASLNILHSCLIFWLWEGFYKSFDHPKFFLCWWWH